MGMLEVSKSATAQIDENVLFYTDLTYVTGEEGDDGTLTDVNFETDGLTSEEADTIENAAQQSGAQGGEGFYLKNGQKADTLTGQFEIQYGLQRNTDLMATINTAHAKVNEACKGVVSTFKQM